ncbi:ACT domain-containing protein [Neobacillus mesonae]|uniref:ACT domain-containing protein n=1 Tax=Neobacillus mesonae TaxID=1193713 RepID=UPI00203FAF38|nr:ACT domain-containing protein [Neobacillus mesonae]MCM3569810.1 ACT domain-containing protein [Neobacillus mesonae]
MKLKILDPIFSIVKIPPTEAIPSWAASSDVFSITRTSEELSIVCPAECLPADEEFKEVEGGWKCIKVEGVLDFGLTGILASLANPLAENQISIFALSTYNTDYLLVKNHSIEKAKFVLEKEGHSFNNI